MRYDAEAVYVAEGEKAEPNLRVDTGKLPTVGLECDPRSDVADDIVV